MRDTLGAENGFGRPPGSAMLSLSGEAWAGLLGGFGGAVVGGLISWLLQLQARQADARVLASDRRERQTGLAHAIIYKLIAIASHYAQYDQGAEAAWANAALDPEGPEPWQFVLGSAHEPDPIHFTTDEMTLLVELRMQDVFNSLLTLADAHNQMGVLSALYAQKRVELRRELPAAAFFGKPLTDEKDKAAFARARPLMVELNSLAVSMKDFSARDAAESLSILDLAHGQFVQKIGLKWKLTPAGLDAA